MKIEVDMQKGQRTDNFCNNQAVLNAYILFLLVLYSLSNKKGRTITYDYCLKLKKRFEQHKLAYSLPIKTKTYYY